ncbi:MAG: dioxygenase, partial [Gammaproteobacteria bacterium]
MTNKYFTERNSEATVISKMKSEDKRYSQLMSSLINHLHQFIKEVEPTQEEWEKAIKFLTDVGHITDAQRQEWVLLSDTLGVSMLVDAIVNRKSSGATESTVLGPFYLPGSEVLQMGADISKEADGESAFISGKVTDVIGNPIAGAQIEVWQANQDGFYDTQQPDIQPPMNLRGTFVTSEDGNYSFKTVKPVPYPIPDDGPVGKMLKKMGRHPYRPAHVHFM